MLAYCNKEGIHLTAYSPLGSPDRVPGMKAENEPSLLENPVIVSIADEHGCTAAQILINWAIERGISVIPKSVNPGRIKENLDAVNLQLTKKDMQLIADLDKHFRYVNGVFWALPGSTYTVSDLWDE
jgi:alcohol dehydrogenase (NADP+)